MHDETYCRLAIQGALVAAMAIWVLNVAVVKALTQSFDPTTLPAVRTVVASAALTGLVMRKRSTLASISQVSRRAWTAPVSESGGKPSGSSSHRSLIT